VQVLLLEPDFWRYLGISQILEHEPDITLIGDENVSKILSLRHAPLELRPDVVILSHSLILDYGISLLSRLQDLFPNCHLLVEGYDATFDGTADLLRGGAQGYFLLSGDRHQLVKALKVVQEGHIWAPREVLGFMIRQTPDRIWRKHSGAADELLSPEDLSIIRCLQQGFTNKEIARSLGIAEVTVKSHLTKLFRRFNVRSRLQLVTYAIRHQLITEGNRRFPTPNES
jgi:DNA-binding NarL/FixJ family response regulator